MAFSLLLPCNTCQDGLSGSGGASFRAAAERLRLENRQSLLRAKPPKDGDAELRD